MTVTSALPQQLALIDDDSDFTEFLSPFLAERGVNVTVYSDSNDLLADMDWGRHNFFVVDLALPGVNGVELIKILRRRSEAGVLVVSGLLGTDVFRDVIQAGADMYLNKPVQFEQVLLAIEAVQRRVVPPLATSQPWQLDLRAGTLMAPDGGRVDLSDIDRLVLGCFVKAQGDVVTRQALRETLGRSASEDSSDGLNAIIYRLRRRIERSTPALVPLQSKSRQGYVFRAPLKVI